MISLIHILLSLHIIIDSFSLGNNMKKCRARFGLDQQSQWCKPCRYVLPLFLFTMLYILLQMDLQDSRKN